MTIKIGMAMSGGVDSSVSAFILKQMGYNIDGVFMQNWEYKNKNCSIIKDYYDAKEVCKKLSIKLFKANFSYEYWNKVFYPMIKGYKKCFNINPDVFCNREIKFTNFLNFSIKVLKAKYIATGHYADKEKIKGLISLKKPKDKNKDQTYFLYMLNQKQLNMSLFPLSNINKEEVREIAKNNNFKNFNKKDSTGICFIGEKNFSNFIKKYIKEKYGNILDEYNNIIGRHPGVYYYSVGQRKGLNIGGIHGKEEKPWYVAKKIISTNTIIAVQNKKHNLLKVNKVLIKKIHWINEELYKKEKFIKCFCKYRYRQKDVKCLLVRNFNNQGIVTFYKPQYSISPGQSIVFYDIDNSDICLGGGLIY